MKNPKIMLMALAAALLLSWNTASAQEGHYYTVTTWKMDVPEDGSRGELNQLLQDFSDKVVAKNDKVISQRIFHHISGSDLRDVVIISEYANWNDIQAAQDRQNQLIAEGWPDKAKRDAWSKKFFSYVVTHSDEIYQEYPDMRK